MDSRENGGGEHAMQVAPPHRAEVSEPAPPVCSGQVVRDYTRYVLGLVRRLGVAEADVDDVAQESIS